MSVSRLAAGHARAVAQALLVTFLWSTSWVLIKVGLDDLDLPPLSFAGLRYFVAALVLLPFALPALRRMHNAAPGRGLLLRTALLGVLLYAVAQGAQFAALVHLPAVAVGLVLTTTPVLVAVAALRGGERPTTAQLFGIGALIVGAVLYFGPLDLRGDAALGLAVAAVGVGANAASALLGRALARDALQALGGVLGLTAVSMAIGSVVLLSAGLASEGVPRLTPDGWLIVAWLAVVNTAFAFTLWNHTLRTLTAVESSVMNNLMLVQIAVLAWVFLDESLSAVEVAGLALALVGVLVVQLAPVGARRRAARTTLPLPEAAGASGEPSAAPRRIILVGMMGSGKSTVGRLLSTRIGALYVDNDEIVQQVFATTPRRVLAEQGEAELRRVESEALRLALETPPPAIIGVPAGTILSAVDRQRLRDAGAVVWLRASAATLTGRAVGADHRPWLENDPEAWMTETLAERDPLYGQVASIVVDTDGRSPEEVVSEIVDRLEVPIATPGQRLSPAARRTSR